MNVAVSVRKTVAVVGALFACAEMARAQTPAAAAHNASMYSTLDEKACKTVSKSKDGEGDYTEQVCPGVAGYRLRVIDGDSRQSITVVSPNGVQHPLRFSEVVTPNFSTVGPRAEWRMHAGLAGAVPVALTVRVNANEDTANPAKVTSYLAVARIDAQQTCVVKVLKSNALALEDARRVADQAGSLPCLKP